MARRCGATSSIGSTPLCSKESAFASDLSGYRCFVSGEESTIFAYPATGHACWWAEARKDERIASLSPSEAPYVETKASTIVDSDGGVSRLLWMSLIRVTTCALSSPGHKSSAAFSSAVRESVGTSPKAARDAPVRSIGCPPVGRDTSSGALGGLV
jgi:hypothetical protein